MYELDINVALVSSLISDMGLEEYSKHFPSPSRSSFYRRMNGGIDLLDALILAKLSNLKVEDIVKLKVQKSN